MSGSGEVRMEVLLVEDNPGDVRLLQEAFRHRGVRTALHLARDAEEALRFLRRRSPFTGAPRPDLVLLDLNLPGLHGGELLAEVRLDAGLRPIRVVVLTSSASEEDFRRCSELGADGYLIKPSSFDELSLLAGAIERFWLGGAVPAPSDRKVPREAVPAAEALASLTSVVWLAHGA